MSPVSSGDLTVNQLEADGLSFHYAMRRRVVQKRHAIPLMRAVGFAA